MSEQKYPHKEISDYKTELFLSAFQEVFIEHVNGIVIGAEDTTKAEVKIHLIDSLMKYLGRKK